MNSWCLIGLKLASASLRIIPGVAEASSQCGWRGWKSWRGICCPPFRSGVEKSVGEFRPAQIAHGLLDEESALVPYSGYVVEGYMNRNPFD